MIERIDDTIVAISSAPGRGSVGIVRLSGPDSISLADKITRLDCDLSPPDQTLANQPGSSRCWGKCTLNNTGTIPASFFIFRAPHSYTRQEMVEIHTVGSPAVLECLRQQLIELGATPAQPGEFTARAFLLGAKSLTQAEAVAGSIRAQSDTQLRATRKMMDGALSKQIQDTRNELAEMMALVEADIDFAEESIDFITPEELNTKLNAIHQQLQKLITNSVSIERFDVLPRILLLGPPNAGKSSLMNCLSGTSRAICATVAGTTRDILSAPVNLGRSEAILLDTAGVDQSEDDIIAQARKMTLSEAQLVDLLCVVIDGSKPIAHHFMDTLKTLDINRIVLVINKIDIARKQPLDLLYRAMEQLNVGPICSVSAITEENIDVLRQLLSQSLGNQVTTTLSEAVMINERQQSAITEAMESLARGMALSAQARETIDCADVLAFELRESLDQLGNVTGEVTTEDLLGQVFANFCIGK